MRHMIRKPAARLFLRGVICPLLLLLVLAGGPATAAPEERPLYIVRLAERPDSAAQADQLAARHHALHRYRYVFQGFAAELSDAALSALQRNPRVQSIEQAFEVHAIAESYPSGVDRIDADLVHGAWQGGGARVAIVDTGIDFNHPDLAGQVDTALSRGFISRGKTTTGGLDDHGHGTHVAGTVAALLGNGIGVVGAAPQATLVALKVLNRNGSGSTADIIAALDYITGYNNSRTSYADMIHVANFSLGGSGSDTASSFRTAFDNTVASGCFIAVAAGNESDDAANHVPAAYDRVFTVSAMDPRNDTFASFSNFGSDVDIAAPGVAITSTVLDGGYASWSGTSMATPHVAGAAALYIGQNIGALNRTTAEASVRAALLGSGEAIALAGDPDGVHEPLVDAQALLGAITPPDPAIAVNVATDKPSYLESDASALLTAQVRDELGAPVVGLTAADFNLGSHAGAVTGFGSVGDGSYAITLDISGFSSDTDYLVTVTVTANTADGTLSDSGSVTIRKASAKTVYISRIDYELVFKNLRGYLTVKDLDDSPVANAAISLTLLRDGQSYKELAITTGSNGVADFRVGNARSGHYNIIVHSITSPGAVYEPLLNATDPGFDVP